MKFLNIFFICLIPVLSISTIINVPSDQPSIQAGIDASLDADTVLVQPGTYFENINYNGKNIIVASLFLTTLDATYISSTFIDGNENNSVVRFVNGEDSTAIISGFTLTNGGSTFFGGGIYCEGSSPTLRDLIIKNNYVSGHFMAETGTGGGICCFNASPHIENVIIEGNHASNGYESEGLGGGLACYNSNPRLINVTIRNNHAHNLGGGIWCYNSSMILTNITITGNFANKGGGIYCHESGLSFDPVERSNVFLNYAGTKGCDLSAQDCNTIAVIVDTFTVLQPEGYFVSPLDNFTFDILHAGVEQVNQDLYVSPTGSNDNNGFTVDEPLHNICYALAKMLADDTNRHTIYLAEGIYSRSQTGEWFPLNCRSYISLSGENEDLTILDAEQLNRVIRCKDDNNFSLENMTIQNGSNNRYGGGIEIGNSSLDLINVTITNNVIGSMFGAVGGGICCNNSETNLENVTVINNAVWGRMISGGGIYCSQSSMTISNSTISGNDCALGGGIECYGSFLNISNTTISDNNAGNGGGIRCSESDVTITDAAVTCNTAYRGGGIYCGPRSNPSFYNVTISGNSAEEDGGGIYCTYDHPALTRVLISENTGSRGGGMFCRYSGPYLEHVTIRSNNSVYGGGIYSEFSTMNFSSDDRCSIYLNNNLNSRGYGTEIYSDNCEVINVVVDTFTVMNPTDYYAYPIDNFTFDIQHCCYELIDSDLYVSPDGDNSNSGISPEEPLKSINYALSRIYSDSINTNTIHLAPGVYSSSTNEEIFPLHWSNYVNLTGNDEDESILDAENNSAIMDFNSVRDAIVSNITITNGYSSANGGGILCHNGSTPSFIKLMIKAVEYSVIILTHY
ncbi:MAG: hypothetical protein JXB60_09550 [Candidatus Cloacimonetes bacterium]|nr:hypothetical protein [Candidatus Cloacimonadota bacterium]